MSNNIKMEEVIIYNHEDQILVTDYYTENLQEVVEEVVEEDKTTWPSEGHGPKNGQVMLCPLCLLKCKGRNELVKHQRAMHPEAKCGTIKCPHEICTYSCYRINQLTQHLKDLHNLQICVTNCDFPCEEDFMEWKEEYELQNRCQFRLSSSKHKGKWRYYNCSRSGFYNPKTVVKRRSKIKGSSKMNGHCISGMNIKIDVDGRVAVIFTETHCGHGFEADHLRLCPSQRTYIEQLIVGGMSYPAIVIKMNKLRNLSSKDEITKKDVVNVAYTLKNKRLDCQYNFKSAFNDWDVDNDLMSLKGNLLFHKAKGEPCPEKPELSKEDFVLCIMSPKQSLSIHGYAEKGLCVEVTRGTNGNDELCLITLMSYDLSKKNKLRTCDDVPLAWCISNVDSSNVKQCFFSIIFANCGILETPFLMTNEGEELFIAWNSIFEKKPFRILSPWAVQDLLSAAVKKFVVGHERQSVLWAQLEQVFSITGDINIEMNNYAQLLRDSVEYKEFGEYFLEKFIKNSPGAWIKAQYAEYAEAVENFVSLTSDLHPKLRSYANKKVGRCAHMLMRHYVTKLHHMDAHFVRKRKRGKKTDPANQIPFIDQVEIKRQTTRALITNVLSLSKKNIKPRSVDCLLEDMMEMNDIPQSHPVDPQLLYNREINKEQKREKDIAQELMRKKEQSRMKRVKRMAKISVETFSANNPSVTFNPKFPPRVRPSKVENKINVSGVSPIINIPKIENLLTSRLPHQRREISVCDISNLPVVEENNYVDKSIENDCQVSVPLSLSPEEPVTSLCVLPIESGEAITNELIHGGIFDYTNGCCIKAEEIDEENFVFDDCGQVVACKKVLVFVAEDLETKIVSISENLLS